MSFPEILLLGAGLAMDAFAVALCKGLSMKQMNRKYALIIAAAFGGFQALMPFLGWLLGMNFEKYIKSVDHWIAFGLLLLIGGKMILDAIREMRGQDRKEEEEFSLHVGELLVLAVATSIDALAIGLTFAVLNVSWTVSTASSLNIWLSVFIIGVTTFLISYAGVWIGNRFGNRFQAKAEIAGGIILILLGTRILLEHLNII